MSDLIITFDTETGGFYSYDKEKDGVKRGPCALLTLGAVAYDYQFDVVINCIDLMINPDTENLVVEDQALKVNKLTLEELQANGIPEVEAVRQFVKFMDESKTLYSSLPPVIPMGHNLSFDLGFLRSAFFRARQIDESLFYPFYTTHRYIDTYTAAQYLNHGSLALEKSINFIYSTFTLPEHVEYHLMNPNDHASYREVIMDKFNNPDSAQHHNAFADACFTLALFRYIRSWLPPEIKNRAI
jgi:DNA polymerase III epsilon subunit-like protein